MTEEAKNGKGTLQDNLQHTHDQLVSSLWSTWKDSRSTAANIDPEKFQRLSVVSLTQVASVAAVDVGMTKEQFVGVCMANFDEALRRAPKWS